LEVVHLQDTWLTIGSFDGVHRGHQEIVKQLSAGAHSRGELAVVLTFFPHPAVVLGRRKDPFYLTASEERATLLSAAGADVVITHPFDLNVAGTSARNFIIRLKEHLQMSHLLVGQDFALGKNREGNVGKLRELGLEFDYTLEVMPDRWRGGIFQ
jgi:riboflavin kinase/FMN adenylyltransferase